MKVPDQGDLIDTSLIIHYFKNGNSRIEVFSEMYNTTTVKDEKGKLTSIKDAKGYKTFSKTSTECYKSINNDDSIITYVDSTKIIARYV